MEIRGSKFWTTVSSFSFARLFPTPAPSRKHFPNTMKPFIRTSTILLILLGMLFSSPPARGSGYEDQYGKARRSYYALKNSETKKKYRSYWLKCIEDDAG